VPRHRPFLCAAYLPDVLNRLTPGSVKACPLSGVVPGMCRIVGRGWRERKTGPFQELKLCHCRVHKLSFTVYPFGMVPYSRRSLIDYPNYFAAVSDATQGIKWPEITPDRGSTFKTQKRHIKLWCQLIGLEPLSSGNERLQASVALGISHLHLREAADRIRAGPTYEGRARIVMGVLNTLTGGTSLATILRQGHSARVWGNPIFDERDRVPLLHFTSAGRASSLSPD